MTYPYLKRLPSFEYLAPETVEEVIELLSEYENEARLLINHGLVLPAYDMVIKCSHIFNILDARGAVSVTERTSYIQRVRGLAKIVAEVYIKSREELGFPLIKKTDLSKK